MATEELFQPHACSRLQKPSGVRWKGLWYLSLLVTSAATAVATAQEVAVAPVYSRSQSGTQTVCRLIQPESHPQLLARFRKAPDKDIGPAHVVTLQGASTWEVTFAGFPDEAEAAFQFAVDIWATFLSSPERIRVEAEFVDLGEPNLLGGAGPTVLVRDFPGDVPDTFFPVSLANALAGNDLFSGADIQVSINSDFPSWYFGIDANPPFNEVDFVSIVLHELAHGLGFSDSFKVDDSDRGSWGLGGRPEIFDRFVEDYLGQNLIDTAVYPQSSIALGSALTDDVFFYGANTSGAELYAPSTFQEGSSIAHLDESTYPSGGANGLMTPAISSGESHHNPGDVVQDILEDLGWRWSNGTVNHSPVADAGPSQEVDELDNVFLSGAGSFDPDGDALSFSWVQTSGPAVSFDETARDPSFQAPDVDGDTTLTLSLTVDDGSASDSDQVNVLVLDGDSNQPPVADAGSDQTVDEGAPVTLDGTDSFDPDGDTLSFQWLQLLGPSVQLAGSDSALPTFTAPEVSSDTQLRFRLTVDDGQEGDTDTVDIEVNHIPGNLPPVARAGPDQAVEEGKQVQLDATSSFDPDGDDLTFSWVQTSGPEVQLPQPGPATLTFEAPLLEQDRVLRFRVAVSDGFLADSDETRVTVYDVKPFGFDLDFAQFAYGGGLASEIWLLSLTAAAATEAVVALTTSRGHPWSLRLNGTRVDGQIEVRVPPGGAVRLVSPAIGPVLSGSVKVTSDHPLEGLVLFSGPFGLAGIPPGPAGKTGFRILVETSAVEAIDTGFSVVNLQPEPATLQVSLLNLDGSQLSTAEPDQEGLKIAGGGQRSLFVTDLEFSPPVDLSNFLGILSASAGQSVGATAIQTRPGEFAVIPVAREKGANSAAAAIEPSRVLDFAHFADGEGLMSRLSLMNLADTTDVDALVIARDGEGALLSIDLLDVSGDALADTRIPANGGRALQTRGKGPLRAGSLRIESTHPLSGVVVFGGDFGLAGVPASQIMESGFRTLIQVDADQQIKTGVAVVNLEDHAVSLEPLLFDTGGEQAAELATDQVILIPPAGQIRFFITDFAWTGGSLDDFFGILEIRASGRVGATAIQTRPGQFAALPVARLPD